MWSTTLKQHVHGHADHLGRGGGHTNYSRFGPAERPACSSRPTCTTRTAWDFGSVTNNRWRHVQGDGIVPHQLDRVQVSDRVTGDVLLDVWNVGTADRCRRPRDLSADG